MALKWMLSEKDPVASIAVAKLARELNITGNPDQASHYLGEVTLSNGNTVRAHVIHAADSIIEDGTRIVTIIRSHEPGAGKPALPGGWLDPTKNGVESVIKGALRETLEEVGIKLTGKGVPVGIRNCYRPDDVRVAAHALPDYGIKEGEVFMVSTQAVIFHVEDLSKIEFIAGDDAKSAGPVLISSITRDYFGIPDHYDMLFEALEAQQDLKDTGRVWVQTTGKSDFGIQ